MSGWLQYLDEPRQLASGRWSRWYVDANALWEHEPTRNVILAWFLAQWSPSVYGQLISVPTGGDKWRDELACRFKGRGPVSVIIEDVTTTGESAERCRPNHGGSVFAVVARGEYEPYRCWARLHLPDYATEEEAR